MITENRMRGMDFKPTYEELYQEFHTMNVIADILWHRPDLDGYWLRVDSEDDCEEMIGGTDD